MMRNINIRSCALKDIPEILPLMEQLGYPTSEEVLESRLKRLIDTKGYGVAVACMEEKIVGLVAWSKSPLFVSDKARIHIEGLIIDQKARGMGVGKRLMEFVEDIARTSGPAIIDLTSGVRRSKDGSHEFYKKMGYENKGFMAKLYFRKEIE
jgi:ribosomal protein S18 acetylase RimI-like enzyme